MNILDDRKYTKDHEWVKVNGNIATVGITEYAASQLGDVVYVELPAEGLAIKKEETFGVLESVKAASDCYAPVSGKIIEINSILANTPSNINEDAYSEGWLIKIEMENAAELDTLMDHTQYKDFIEAESM